MVILSKFLKYFYGVVLSCIMFAASRACFNIGPMYEKSSFSTSSSPPTPLYSSGVKSGTYSLFYKNTNKNLIIAGSYDIKLLQKFLGRFREHLIFFPNNVHTDFYFRIKRTETEFTVT